MDDESYYSDDYSSDGDINVTPNQYQEPQPTLTKSNNEMMSSS